MAVIVDRASHAAQAVNRHSERRRTERRLARCREEMERTLTEYGRACFFDASDRESLRSQVAALTQEKDALTARLDSLRGVIRCPECGNMIFPKVQPAVIIAVTNGDKLLLTKYADRPHKAFALVAGFVEIGETLEECVQREVMEEVGMKVRNIRYYKSQPWGIDDDLLAGFFCDVDGDDTIHLDHQELKEGAWMTREDVPGEPDDYSLTNEMMMLFKAGKEPR